MKLTRDELLALAREVADTVGREDATSMRWARTFARAVLELHEEIEAAPVVYEVHRGNFTHWVREDSPDWHARVKTHRARLVRIEKIVKRCTNCGKEWAGNFHMCSEAGSGGTGARVCPNCQQEILK